MSTQLAVRLDTITKRYAGHVAVRALSLAIPRGAVYGLLGPNGAGKTTTIRMILGIVRPDAGSVEVLGNPGGGWAVNEKLGYLPEERGLYRKMKVLELLVFLGQAKGMPRGIARRGAADWLERLGLLDWKGHKVDDLSKGMQQKVQFIATVLHRPELVVLDEPFAGLDPVNSQVLKDSVQALARDGTTVLFCTHVMEQAERLCDSVCIIARGEKVLDGVLSEIKRNYPGVHIKLAVAGGFAGLDSLLADSSVIRRADRYANYAELELAPDFAPSALLRRIVEEGFDVTRFEVSEASLNQIFIDRVGAAAAVPSAIQDERA